MASHNDLGKLGEEFAKNYLVSKGYSILEKNWRFQKAEVDIIALHDEALIAIEVKTRSSKVFGNPQDFVTIKKRNLLTMAMDHYIQMHDLNVELRFDIIAIYQNNNHLEIEHLENAFLHL